MTKAVVFLSASYPHYRTVDFGIELQHSYDVHYVIDSDGVQSLLRKRRSPAGNVSIINIPGNIATQAGYWGTVVYYMDRACSKDKALYFLANVAPKYDFVWLIEDDVLIPSNMTLQYLDDLYPETDLLVPPFAVRHFAHQAIGWHWPKIAPLIAFPFPWGQGLTCAVRFSQKFIQNLGEYANKEKKLFHDEALFTTLAMNTNLTIATPEALKTIAFRPRGDFKHVDTKHLYHPVKDVNLRDDWHLIMQNATPEAHPAQPVFGWTVVTPSWESWIPVALLIAVICASVAFSMIRSSS